MVHQLTLPFFRGNLRLVGRLFRNTDSLDVRQPAIMVTGSWLTVKEQMPELYALRLAERGYTAFTFDFTGFGQSEGEPRQAEIPDRKIGDLIAAADFVSTLSCVETDTLTHLAICASAQYVPYALARGCRITRFVSVAGWYHDTASVAPFYGGPAGMATRVNAARVAVERYVATGAVDTVQAYKAGDLTAAMFADMDYYGSPTRGAIPAWKNAMATLSWLYWLTFDGLSAADSVDVPVLMVHSDAAVLPDNVRLVYDRLRGPKQRVWTQGSQTDFYDRPEQVGFAVDAIDAFLKETAGAVRRRA